MRIVVLVCCLLMVPSVIARPLLVAVAANFAGPLEQLVQHYEQQTGETIQVSVASSGALYAQLLHGAPFDVFLSADAARVDALIAQQRVVQHDTAIYATGQLALAVRTTQPDSVEQSLQFLYQPRVSVAIANPAVAPYGKAAQQVIDAMGLNDTLRGRLVTAANVQQVRQFLVSGAVDAAFLSLAQAKVQPLSSKAVSQDIRIYPIPSSLHQPIIQKLAVTAPADRYAAARRFADFLLSEDGQAMIAQAGYLTGEHNDE
ncbi:molybdate ABC transporter substrate-binding protein [Alteromonas sp. CYL-A6]|uniref:molybdate ABC transporter substrate-binding protein n=1 Tax=Alteromonas nitratireducens TaxID=3390813 RepID=UPI0034B3F9C2